MNVLVTGGAGYIGAHAALRLLEAGHGVTIVDNLVRGHRQVVDILKPFGDLHFVEGDYGDYESMHRTLRDRGIDLVMHFGGLTYVGESVEQPLQYYTVNAAGAMNLLRAMSDAEVEKLVFSSTCATYGEPPAELIPITEDCPQQPINPYGRSKLMVEHVLFDHASAKAARHEPFAFAALRYFNVAGCDRGGRIGEDHRPETHLIPICLDAALGKHTFVTIYGTDYPMPDGTCIRDYVHVEDLIDAHITAMQSLKPGDQRAYNVGIGSGYSVRQVIDACRRVTGVRFKAKEGPRRPGDPPQLFADPSKIRRELGWSARYTSLDEIIATAWRWRAMHPDGYQA